MVRFSLSVKVLVVTLSATANWVCFIYMSNGSILINRAAKVLIVSRPESKLLPNVTWFLLLLGLLITIIILLILGLWLLLCFSYLFFLKDTMVSQTKWEWCRDSGHSSKWTPLMFHSGHRYNLGLPALRSEKLTWLQ